MIRRPPRSTLFPYTTALPIYYVFTVPVIAGATGLVIAVTTLTLLATIMLRSEEHTSELQSRLHLVCRLLLEKKKNRTLQPDQTPPDRAHSGCWRPVRT